MKLATGDCDLETPTVGRVPSPGGLEGFAAWGHAAYNLETSPTPNSPLRVSRLWGSITQSSEKAALFMKKSLQLVAAIVALGFAGTAFAKDVTLTGEGKCAKCALKKADKCQNVVEVKDGDKTTTYYLKGAASDKFHKEICGETKKVEVVGEVSEADGKKWLTVSSIKAK